MSNCACNAVMATEQTHSDVPNATEKLKKEEQGGSVRNARCGFGLMIGTSRWNKETFTSKRKRSEL